MTIPTFLAGVVILVALPINWIVTWRLWRLSRQVSHLRVLRERTLLALTLSLVVTLFAGVFVNNSFFDPHGASAFASMIITRLAILALTIPALYWLYLYRNGRRD